MIVKKSSTSCSAMTLKKTIKSFSNVMYYEKQKRKIAN